MILRAVARPARLMGATREITYIVLGVTIFFYFVTLNGFIAFLLFGVGQAIAVVITKRDPDLMSISNARSRCKAAPALDGETGHWYSGS